MSGLSLNVATNRRLAIFILFGLLCFIPPLTAFLFFTQLFIPTLWISLLLLIIYESFIVFLGIRLRQNFTLHPSSAAEYLDSLPQPDNVDIQSLPPDKDIPFSSQYNSHNLKLLSTFLGGHTDTVWSIAWSPDDNLFASGSADRTICLWDAHTGHLLHTLQGHTGTVWSVTWSPDGALLASGSADRTICLWDAHTGQLLHTFQGHTGTVQSIAWSPDGALFASGSYDRTIRLWDAHSKQSLHTLQGHTGTVQSIAWSPDGTLLASGSADQTIRLWDAHSKQSLHTLQGHTGMIRSVTWSPDGALFASGSVDRTIRLWDAHSKRLLHTLQGHTDSVNTLAWSPDGTLLASGSADQTIRLWDTHTKRLLHTLQGHTNIVNTIAWSHDSAQLASGSYDRTIRLWDAHTRHLLHTLEGYTDTVNTIAWSHDSAQLASGSYDRTIRLWDAHTKQSLHTLQGHTDSINTIVWSPDDTLLASGSTDQTIRLWDAHTGQLLRILQGHTDSVNTLAWSLDGALFASGSTDQTIRLWDAHTKRLLHTLQGHTDSVNTLAWSPDGALFASGSTDQTIRLWDAHTKRLLHTLQGHTDSVNTLAWSPDSAQLASGSTDQTIRLWDAHTKRLLRILQGYTDSVNTVAWSPDGALLASNGAASSDTTTVFVWLASTGEVLAKLTGLYNSSYVAWHPHLPLVVTPGPGTRDICVWQLESKQVIQSHVQTSQYVNAKVVLVGDSGVGKSGLGLVLSGQPFEPTYSTHKRNVWTFDTQEVSLDERRKEMRETLLWDLAGQPAYRLIHQLYLNEVTVALVVFNARSDTDPFAGVRHWDTALRQAQRIQGSSALPLKKFLISARIDTGGISVSHERTQALVKELGFDGYFETSAKEGWQIAELRSAIREAVNWEALPKVNSSTLFQQMKQFLVDEKKQQVKQVISTAGDLYRTFLHSKDAPSETPELPAQFETCIRLIEAAGLIKRLSFGDLVLLQPEYLDSYASALVITAKDEPDGLGSIPEQDARTCNFTISKDDRIDDIEQEKLLLIAMVEDLLRRELVLREGDMLVFPSQSTKDNPHMSDPKSKTVIFEFQGAILNIYTTLAVRLAHSETFKKSSLWKNAITYTSNGGTFGLFLQHIDEGRGELILFSDEHASPDRMQIFEEYVHSHLRKHALPDSVIVRRPLVCATCGNIIPDDLVQRRKKWNSESIVCSVCESRISLKEQAVPPETPSTTIRAMDRAADKQRDREAAKMMLEGKIKTNDFDVFLCHSGNDKAEVKQIGEQLKQYGILPWLDEWELPPGQLWQPLLEEQIGKIKAAAVFVGNDGRGPWRDMEIYAFLRKFAQRPCPVIPVILSSCQQTPQLPLFLEGITWVDFRQQEPDPMQRLLWGITEDRNWLREL